MRNLLWCLPLLLPMAQAETYSWWDGEAPTSEIAIYNGIVESISITPAHEQYWICNGIQEARLYRNGSEIPPQYSNNQGNCGAAGQMTMQASLIPGDATYEVHAVHVRAFWTGGGYEYSPTVESEASIGYNDPNDPPPPTCSGSAQINGFIPLQGVIPGTGFVELYGSFSGNLTVEVTDGSNAWVDYQSASQVNVAFINAPHEGEHSLRLWVCDQPSTWATFTTPICVTNGDLIDETSTYEGVGSLSGLVSAKFKGVLQGYGPYTSLEGRIVEEQVTGGPAGTNTCFALTQGYGQDPLPQVLQMGYGPSTRPSDTHQRQATLANSGITSVSTALS